ncbi:hypothetical protein F2Q69_00044295 [Brassica cretica]|uniref:Uncharacterized protein n=1 Tax=Brassica cretica TaxID=69181 RepID=A0A8S9NMC2_BRACR|nr:hypothetical protein F2Q69_00044295 [Brassica cretica]
MRKKEEDSSRIRRGERERRGEIIVDFVEERERERRGEIIVDIVEEASRRSTETRRDHRRGVVEEASRRSTETRRDHRRGVVEEASRRLRDTNTIKSSIDHGVVGEIERHEETSAPIDHSAIMVESTERSVSSRGKMAESSRKKHTQLVFRERERERNAEC